MKDNSGEEHKLPKLYFVPECGGVYDLKLIPDGKDGRQPVLAEEE